MANLLVTIEKLTKSYGDRLLFGDVTFGINEGDKIGLIAKNGTGKTTMLSIIAGIETADSGTVTMRGDLKVGFLEQTPHFSPGCSVMEACLQDDTPATRAVIAYEKALASGDNKELERAMQMMDAAGAWDYEDRVARMLTQLRITDHNAPVETLSGGQQKRIAIARVLLSDPDLIILDEPTNHLDIGVIEWLENFLVRSTTTLLMVTHDRYFLDRVCNKIIEIDRQEIFTYQDNYDNYLRRRQERIDALTGELAKVKNTLRREQEWMRRQPQARAGKAKYRIDRFYDLREKARADYSERHVKLGVESTYIGNKIFEAVDVSKRFGDKMLLDSFSYIFARYERVGIVGDNGVGKSTFIKMLQGIVSPDSGRFDIGETVKFGYYSQEGIKFNPEKKVIDAVTEICEDIVINNGQHYTPMQFLQHFLFTPADQQKYIAKLSGGERARLHLATVLMRSPNFLILDEPTNDLDIVTLGLLEEYLAGFKGCLIVVSHDRYFLDKIVDHLFVFQGDGVVKDFPGNYTDYREFLARQAEEEAVQEAVKKQQEPQRRHADRSGKLTFKERRELEELTAEIESLEAEKAELDQAFSSGEVVADIADKARRYEEVKARLDEAELRWLELSEKEP